MIRTTFLAFALVAALVANAPANEPTNELETAVLEIMNTAFCVSDYDTVETLFDKLSAEGKKKFLQVSSKLAAGEVVPGGLFDCTLLDAELRRYNISMQEAMNDTTRDERLALTETRAKYLEDYLPKKFEQTQLLGRLTLSLFEPSVAENPQVALDSKAYYVVFQSPAVGERVLKFPFTGKETVLDALSNSDLQPNASQRIWIARRVKNSNYKVVLPVNWEAITAYENPETNYQLLPDDRVNVVEEGEQPRVVLQPVKQVRLLTQGNEIEIRVNEKPAETPYRNFADVSNPHDPPIVSVNLPHLENREQINGKYTIGPDGYLTFGYGGRAYIDGLTVDECREAIEFHFAKYKVVPQSQPQPFSPYQVPQAASERQAVR